MLKVVKLSEKLKVRDLEPGTLFKMSAYPYSIYMVVKQMDHVEPGGDLPVVEFATDSPELGPKLNGFLSYADVDEVLGKVVLA